MVVPYTFALVGLHVGAIAIKKMVMTEIGLKAKIVGTLAAMLVLGICLQSIVFIFLGVSTSIQEDMTWTMRTLQPFTVLVSHARESEKDWQELLRILGRLLDDKSETLSCIKIELGGESAIGESSCQFPVQLFEKSQIARATGKPAVGFAGAAWNVFMIRSEVAILALPLRNNLGQVIGAVSIERPLSQVYSRYEQEAWIAIIYLFINAIIILGIGFFRLERILFRPLDRLVQKTENYSSDQQTMFLVSDDESAFRKLSISFTSLLGRIESDNRKLRLTVHELEEANDELKQKSELIVRSEKLAVAGRLSAGLAHEIGNPLSIIQGYIELLSRSDLTEDEKRRFSDKAQLELDRIKRLLRQLLDFAGPIRSMAGPLSVNAAIEDVIAFVSLEKTFAGCRIITKFYAKNDHIFADKDTIRQVLINCLLNAADATAADNYQGGEIVVETFNEESSSLGPVLVVSVKDNGVGIEKNHLAYIFDPFYTTKEIGRGTGLGLFVCYTIMERLGGAISLCNRAHSGIEVKLEFPLPSETAITQPIIS